MGKDFELDQFTLWATDVASLYLLMDGSHLLERELTGGDHHIGIAGEEFHRLDIGDVGLGGNMDLDPLGAGIVDDGHVRGYDGRDPFALRPVDDGVHLGNLVVIDDRIDGEIGADAVGVGDGAYLGEVFEREVVGRAGAHIELADTEIDRVGTRLYSRGEGLVGAHRSHHFDVLD